MEAEFDKCGVDLHRHEVTHMEDDFKKGERVVKVKSTRYFVMGK
jgi:hypothetical protein